MKNKILVPFVGDSLGGSHKSILEIYEKLHKKRVNMVFLLHKKTGPLINYLNKKNISYEYLEINKLSGEKPSIFDIFFTNIINYRKFRKYLKNNNITLVHCNDLRTNLSWSIPTLITGIPVIWHQRTLISSSYWWRIIKFITSKYIVTSEAILKKSPSNLRNISIIHNPVILKKVLKKNTINKNKIIKIGYCGRIVKEKSVEHLLNSFIRLLSENNKYNFKLYIAGRGDNKFIEYLKDISKNKNCFEKIKFIGFVENPYKFINDLNILICPSSIDGFGRTIIEAMSVKTPVIAANAGGHKDLINHFNNGVLYKPNDDEDLVSKIFAVLKNKDLKNKIISNGKKYAESFSSDIIADKIFDIYQGFHKKFQFKKQINILHIDIEGGWGGSSKSLFELVKIINNKISDSSIIIGQEGKIVNEYNKLKISNYYIENLFSFVPRKKNSFKILVKNSIKLIYFPLTLYKIISKIKKNNIELLHLNYEGLFLYGLFIKFFTRVKIIIHMRTLLPKKNIFSTIIIFLISKLCADYIFFISKNEELRYLESGKYKKIPGKVLLNIFNSNKVIGNNYKKDQYIITYLGNINHNKGVDRLIDLAKYFKKMKDSSFLISIYGAARDSKQFYLNLLEQKKIFNLDNIEFNKHTLKITEVLLNSFILIRPSRDNDPWGRDVIEAATLGLPVIATGSFNQIIKNNKNGYLINNFNCKEIYDYCNLLKDNKNKWQDFRKYSINNVRNKYVGIDQKIIFEEIINNLLK